MKANIKIVLVFMSLFLLHTSFCEASFFEMNLREDSIYTPGNIKLTMELTEQAKFENNYQFKVSIFLTGTLVREQTIKAERQKPVNFELVVPEVFDRTEGRCRCELLIGDSFLEAQELPLLLFPALEPYKQETLLNTEIWVYDTSGKLLDLFRKMEVKVVDATFKTARDFGKPDIVFVGENTDPNNMQIITESISAVTLRPIVIYLKQKQFIKESKIEVHIDKNIPKTVVISRDNAFMTGFDIRDIMSLAKNAGYLKIKKDETDMTIKSYVDEVIEDEKNIYSYLCTVKKDSWITIYCQLPITDGSDPRAVLLLKNILQYAESENYRIKTK